MSKFNSKHPYDCEEGSVTAIKFKGEYVALCFIQGRWVSEDGTVYAFQNQKWAVDNDVRVGIGPLCLPEGDPLTPAAQAHDYAYSSPVYQENHGRSEADELLRKQLYQLAGKTWRKVLVEPLYNLVRLFGGAFWETDKTRNK